MRTGTWPLAALGLLVTSLAVAGPGEKRTLQTQSDEGRDRSGKTQRIAADTQALLAPLLGKAVAVSVELVDRARFDALAAEAGESDSTAFADHARHALVALDMEVDATRARVIAHETAKLHLAKVLGARPAPWLEEGLACAAEDAWLQGVELGSERADPDRAARARHVLRDRAPLGRIVALPAAAFERGDSVHRDVTVAWAATQQLLHGSSKARRALAAYADTLRVTRDHARAEKAFEQALPLAELERALYSR